MIYTHVMNKGGRGVKSPLNRIEQPAARYQLAAEGLPVRGNRLETRASRAFPAYGIAEKPLYLMRELASARRSTRLLASARVKCSCAPTLMRASAAGSNSARVHLVMVLTVAWRVISPPRI